jgi:hypothetical protein
MKMKGIIGFTIAGSVVILLTLASRSESDLTSDIVKDSKYAMGNEAIHMVGCQALPESETPRIILPPVVKTFVSLPCATEVPPPTEAIEYLKRNTTK